MTKKLILLGLICTMLLSTAWAADEEDAIKAVMATQAIDWNKLASFLPAGDGMKLSDVDGGTMNMADPTNPAAKISYSTVERDYSKGDKEITIRIMDTGFSQFLLMPFAMMAMEYDGADGSMKNATVSGLKAKILTEKDDGEVTDIQVMVLVSERILVNGEGNEYTTVNDVKAMVEKIDMEKLASLAAKQKEAE